MPEGDTIFRTAAALAEALSGRRIVTARPEGLRRVEGALVIAVEPVGKHLLIRFDNGWSLHSHMRMRGAWHVYAQGEQWRRPQWQVRALLDTGDVLAVCFGAPVVQLVRDARAPVKHLGPDILSEDWNADEIVRRARALGEISVGEALLDQRITAGIGNVYRCETLWLHRVNPWKRIAELDDAMLVALYSSAREAMRGNLDTWKRRFPGYGRGAVHGLGGRPCRRCGSLIRVRPLGEQARLAYWCPTCQPS